MVAAAPDDELRLATQELAKVIADYKKDVKTAKAMESSAKPKVKKAAKGKAVAETTDGA